MADFVVANLVATNLFAVRPLVVGTVSLFASGVVRLRPHHDTKSLLGARFDSLACFIRQRIDASSRPLDVLLIDRIVVLNRLVRCNVMLHSDGFAMTALCSSRITFR